MLSAKSFFILLSEHTLIVDQGEILVIRQEKDLPKLYNPVEFIEENYSVQITPKYRDELLKACVRRSENQKINTAFKYLIREIIKE